MKVYSSGFSPSLNRPSFRRLIYWCPFPPGLQVMYRRLGKPFTPRTQAAMVLIWYSVICVASSMQITSYSWPWMFKRSSSRLQYMNLTVEPLGNENSCSVPLYLAKPCSSIFSGLIWFATNSG